jgi:hypothetical protein
MAPIPTQTNPVQILPSYSLRPLWSHLRLDLPSSQFHSGLPTRVLHTFLISAIHAIWPHANFLYFIFWIIYTALIIKWSSYGSVDMMINLQPGSPTGATDFVFSTASRPILGPARPSIQWTPGYLSPEIERPWVLAQSSAKINNSWRYTSTLLYVFMSWCLIKQQDQFTFPLWNCLQSPVPSSVLCTDMNTSSRKSVQGIRLSRWYFDYWTE